MGVVDGAAHTQKDDVESNDKRVPKGKVRKSYIAIRLKIEASQRKLGKTLFPEPKV